MWFPVSINLCSKDTNPSGIGSAGVSMDRYRLYTLQDSLCHCLGDTPYVPSQTKKGTDREKENLATGCPSRWLKSYSGQWHGYPQTLHHHTQTAGPGTQTPSIKSSSGFLLTLGARIHAYVENWNSYSAIQVLKLLWKNQLEVCVPWNQPQAKNQHCCRHNPMPKSLLDS